MNQSYLFYLLFESFKIIHKKYSVAIVFILSLVITTIFGFNFTLQAQTFPQTISYQGKLVQNGIPFAGSATMIFELINPTTNAIAWTETQTINVQEGLYSVVLGSQTAFTPTFFSQNPSLGLRVSVNGNALTAITVLQAVPYAHAAGSVSDNSITSLKITNGTIQTIDLESGGQSKILATDANGLVVWIDRSIASIPTGTAGGDLTGTYPTPLIANDAVTELKIADNAVTTNKINNNAVTELKIADNAITTNKINNNAVTELKIADNAITTNKINDNAVTELKIVDNAITTNKILNRTIKAEDIEVAGTNEVLISNGIGVNWTPISSLSISENDPKVGNLLNNTIPRWNVSTLSSLVNGSIVDNGSSLFTIVPFIFQNSSPIIYSNGTNTSTLSFPFLTNNQLITFPNASGTVALLSDIPIFPSFDNGLNLLTSDPTKFGLGGSLVENTVIDANANEFELINAEAINFESNNDVTIEAGSNVNIQPNGGNVTIGNAVALDSDIFINGSLHLEPLPALLGASHFYNNGGDLYWGGQNLSQAGMIWEELNPNAIFYQGSTASNVGIGNFTSGFPPQTNLHIRTIGQEADLRVATLINGGNLNQSSTISLRTAINNSNNEDNVADNQVVGKLLFEGYNVGNFAESGKIDVVLTNATNFKNNMRFSVEGIEKMSISDNEVKMLDTDFTILNSSVNQKNVSISLGSNPTGAGGSFFVNAQNSNFNDASATGGYINLFAGANIQPNGIGGNANLNAGAGGTGTNGKGGDVGIMAGNGNFGGNVTINAGTGTNRGIINIQQMGGNVNIGNNGFPNSELVLNGFITLPNLLSFSPSANNLYSTGGNLFWGAINLSAPSTSLLAGSGLSDDGTYITLGGILSNDTDIDGNEYDFGISNVNAISFDANSFTVNAPTISPSATANGGSIDLSAQSIVTGGGMGSKDAAKLFLEGGTLSTGGKVAMAAGNANNGNGGDVEIKAGNANSQAGKLSLLAGNGTGGSSNGGDIDIFAGGGIASVGAITIRAGSSTAGYGNVNIQDNGGRVNIGGFGNAKLNVTQSDDGNAFSANNVLFLEGFDPSFNTIILEVKAVEEAKVASFNRTGNTPTTNSAVVINEGNVNSTSSVLELVGNNNTNNALFIKHTNTNATSKAILVNNDINNPIFEVRQNGNAFLAGSPIMTSDIRYKKQINTLTNSLSNIQKLRGTNYYWKENNKDQKLQFGVIAQEIEDVFPNLVHTNEEGYKSVNYIGLVPVLIEATKEQQTIIDNQKEEISTQKTELENLKKQIAALKVIVVSLQENENKNSTSALAQKVEALEKQLIILVESLSNKTENKENTTQTVSLKEE